MKIIKMGNEPKSVNTYELKCEHCGCIFTFETDDVIVQDKRFIGFMSFMSGSHIKCPCCGIILEYKSWVVL